MKRLLQFVLPILFVLPLYAQGSTYYVDNCVVTGIDTNNGTSPTTPWLTVAKVNGISFNPGDTILFQGGCTWREQLIPKTSGPITFSSYGAGQATLNGSAIVTGWALSSGNIYTSTISWGPYGYAVWEDGTLLTKVTSTAAMTAGTFYESGTTIYVWTLDGTSPSGHTIEVSHWPTSQSDGLISLRAQSYITINNLNITKANWYGVCLRTANYITVQDSTFIQTYHNAISPYEQGIYANSTNLTVLGNTFDHVGITRPFTGQEGVAVNVLGIQTGLIDSNTITNNYGESIVVLGGASNITISNNHVSYGKAAGIYILAGYGAGGDTTNTTVTGNLVDNVPASASAYVIATETTTNVNGLTMTYNVANCGSLQSSQYALRLGGSGGTGVYENMNIYGNTFANCPYGIASVSNAASGPNNVFQNNIISTNQYYDIIMTDQTTSNYTFAYNLLYTPYSTAIRWWNRTALTNYTLAQFNSTYGCPGQWHCNSIQANPNFVGPPNFALAAGSPAIGKGTNLGTTYQVGLNPASAGTLPFARIAQNANWDIGAFVHAPTGIAPPLDLFVVVQ
jgi:hypothetical protein